MKWVKRSKYEKKSVNHTRGKLSLRLLFLLPNTYNARWNKWERQETISYGKKGKKNGRLVIQTWVNE
ncbi:hypothetical protein HanHA300_Chr09g0324451 [Helianthus annuus]|nr:hypothetical protein HanHA300_Chr09g0324451 [Helianthus annuus]KAJ0542941.1 hypothetical protein HanHA89_Chr09g0345361 [Helianthus annuus]KAJ0707996.1 hypothetical protein HanLR1_Chr09g0324691 [Helianthus annuus]